MDTFSVLAVDEDDVLRRVIMGVLRTEGYRVHCVRSVREARDLLDVFQVDALLVDTALPRGEGLALLEDAKANGSAMARVLLVDKDLVPEAVRATGMGLANTMVLKPVLTMELIETLARMRDRRHPAVEISRPRRAAATRVDDVRNTG